MAEYPNGAFVLSLDFELHWGVFDTVGPDSPYMQNLLGEWTVIPKMLQMFREREIAATWATVGFLFARGRKDLERFRPDVLPRYANPALDSYAVQVGEDEKDDPIHFAPSLIERVAETPRQEIATHTYSHYYCCEDGCSVPSFRADLASAIAIAREYGHEVGSIVLPRNMVREGFLPVIREMGLNCYRGLDPSWMYNAKDNADFQRPEKRIGRLIDRYVNISGHNLTRWRDVVTADGLCNVPATRYLQPLADNPGLDRGRLLWICDAIREAAQKKRIVHLWWHPHDFGLDQDGNLEALRTILDVAVQYRESHGLQSITMAEVAQIATSGRAKVPA